MRCLILRATRGYKAARCRQRRHVNHPSIFVILLPCAAIVSMSLAPPPPPPGQREAAARSAAADNLRALASPVLRFTLTCAPCQSPLSPALKPERAHQRLTVQVHAARSQSWFWTRLQQHLSLLRDGQPVHPNCFIDAALEHAHIDLTALDPPMPSLPPARNTPPPPPTPPPLSPGGGDQWWTPHALQLDGGSQQAFAGQETLAETGVTDGCTMIVIVRQWEGTLPSC
jgi:hypothetical protein